MQDLQSHLDAAADKDSQNVELQNEITLHKSKIEILEGRVKESMGMRKCFMIRVVKFSLRRRDEGFS